VELRTEYPVKDISKENGSVRAALNCPGKAVARNSVTKEPNMADQGKEYEKRAMEYEEQANRVTDPWIREKYLALAKRCREMEKAPQSQENRPHRTRIAR
jgi:hypothetical protein